MEATTKRRSDIGYILGSLGGFLGGVWLIVWPFLSWLPGSGIPSIWDRGAFQPEVQAAGVRDIVYGVLMILFTSGCMYGWKIKLGGTNLGELSLYGFVLLTLALLILPFVFGFNPGGSNADPWVFQNDIITGIVNLFFVIPYLFIIIRARRAGKL